jgi:hypothetical protein
MIRVVLIAIRRADGVKRTPYVLSFEVSVQLVPSSTVGLASSKKAYMRSEEIVICRGYDTMVHFVQREAAPS